MKSGYHNDLEEVALSLEILSSTRYSLNGDIRDLSKLQIFPGPDAAIPGLRENTQPETSVLPAFIESELYNKLYHRPRKATTISQEIMETRDFICALSRANQGVGAWDSGWRILAAESDETLAVTKDNLIVWAKPAEIRKVDKKTGPGEYCHVKIGKEITQLFPNFYIAIGNGNEQGEAEIDGPVTRVYWNLTPTGAVQYIGLVTTQLNTAKVPFRTKVISDPRGYLRADAGVLYIRRNDWIKTKELIAGIHQEIAASLNPETPMFTKRLGYGLGLAEDPGNGMSFGESRCKIIVHGLWSHFLQGKTSPQARLDAIIAAFQKEGVDPERPYLNHGSTDIYEMTL